MTIETFEQWRSELAAFGSDDDRPTMPPCSVEDTACEAFEEDVAARGEWQARLSYVVAVAQRGGQ